MELSFFFLLNFNYLRLKEVKESQQLKFLIPYAIDVYDYKFQSEASVAERLSYPLCKPGVRSSIPGFSSLSDETLNRGPVSVWP